METSVMLKAIFLRLRAYLKLDKGVEYERNGWGGHADASHVKLDASKQNTASSDIAIGSPSKQIPVIRCNIPEILAVLHLYAGILNMILNMLQYKT